MDRKLAIEEKTKSHVGHRPDSIEGKTIKAILDFLQDKWPFSMNCPIWDLNRRGRRYAVDLAFPKHLVAVECDERGHCYYSKHQEEERQKFIENKGYVIIRYNPDDPDFDVFTVAERIKQALIIADKRLVEEKLAADKIANLPETKERIEKEKRRRAAVVKGQEQARIDENNIQQAYLDAIENLIAASPYAAMPSQEMVHAETMRLFDERYPHRSKPYRDADQAGLHDRFRFSSGTTDPDRLALIAKRKAEWAKTGHFYDPEYDHKLPFRKFRDQVHLWYDTPFGIREWPYPVPEGILTTKYYVPPKDIKIRLSTRSPSPNRRQKEKEYVAWVRKRYG